MVKVIGCRFSVLDWKIGRLEGWVGIFHPSLFHSSLLLMADG